MLLTGFKAPVQRVEVVDYTQKGATFHLKCCLPPPPPPPWYETLLPADAILPGLLHDGDVAVVSFGWAALFRGGGVGKNNEAQTMQQLP